MSEHDEFIIPGEVDSLDAVPENLRGAYSAGEDGKFRPRVGKTASGYAFENVVGLRSSVEAARAEARAAKQAAKEAQERLSRFGELDPDETAEIVERFKSGKVTDRDQMAQREAALKKQLDEKFQAELRKRDEQIETFRRDAQERLVASDGLTAISRHGGNPDLLMPLIEKSVKVVQGDDGKLRAVVMNDRGEPRISMRDGETGEMTLDEWIGDIVKNDPRFEGAFAQRARGGAGGDRLGARNVSGLPDGASITQRLVNVYKTQKAR